MIQVEGLTKRYGERTVVNELTFTVAPGRLLAMLGPNGAGKTTTVRMIMGLVEPTTGNVRIGNEKLESAPREIRRKIGATFEYPGLYMKMRIGDYLRYFGRLYGVGKAELDRRIEKYMSLFELNGHEEKILGLYSRGMQQKVALCRALIHEPQVLLLDEPTSGLDPGAAFDLRLRLKSLCREENRTVLLCTHVLEEADQLADEIIVLNGGRIVARDTPENLKAIESAGREYELRCLRPSPNALDIIAELPGVVEGSEFDGGLTVRFRIQDPERIPEILRRLLEKGVSVSSFTPLGRTLEQVYLELTRGGGR